MTAGGLDGLRLAVFSPVPPAPTGIADYVADLLPLLPDDWEIDLFVDQEVNDVDARVLARWGVHPHQEWEHARRARPYDLQIYQIGNNPLHEYALPYVAATPGLLVLHDAILHSSRVAQHLARSDLDGYRRVAAAAYPEAGRALGHLVAGGLAGASVYRAFPLCEDLVRASLRTVVHTEPLAEWLRAQVGSDRIGTVVHWHKVASADPERVAAWRERAGAGNERPVIGLFGHVGAAHRLDLALDALGRLRDRHDFRLLVGGAVDPALDAEERARRLQLDDRVLWAGRLSDADFAAAMGAADLALNLRYPTVRSSSGPLQQLLQLGKPVVIHDLMHLASIPDDVVARVATGPRDQELEELTSVLDRWLGDPAARQGYGERAASWAAERITPAAMRDSYLEAIGVALERRRTA